MAETLWNDIVYTDVMQSDGFVVDYAVCTTYSLDMPTLLSVPFMLGTMADLTDAVMRSPHLILEAVNRSAGKFAVFCNAGCIAVPQTNSKMYALLERSVVQIALPAKGKGFVNFHPKVWVIKETNHDTNVHQIKVVVLSRNLTCSSDLDVVCELIGTVGKKQAAKKAQTKHAPLIDFLTWLTNKSGDHSIRKNIRAICNDISCIERFSLTDSPFNDYNFFPMGINGYDGHKQCLTENILDHAEEMIVISPFIDKETLEQMTSCCPKARKTLITRHASLTNDVLAMFNDGVYAPKEVLTDMVEKDIVVDLHEKVFFVRNYQSGYNNHLYLGSTNATRNGFGRNVEFLLELTFAPYKVSYEKFRSDLINNSKDCMFEKVESIPANDTPKEDVTNELLLRRAIAAIQETQITRSGNSYDVTIQYHHKKMPEVPVYISPLGCEDKESLLTDELVFGGMELAMLTEFYVIRIGKLKRVIKLDTIGMPIEERDKAIFRSFINSKSKFINYLAFMLTDDAQQYILESQQLERELTNCNTPTNEQEISTSLYEDMVRMAYAQPERIASIRQVIEKADKAVIPNHFVEMYTTFESTIKQIKHL